MKRLNYSIRAILLFSFVLVGGLPILMMGFITVRLISADIAQDVRENNLLIAQSLSAEAHLLLQRSYYFLKQIEETVIEKCYIQEAEINAYLGSSLINRRDFESIEILDTEGNVRFMAPVNPDIIGINRSGQLFFTHVIQEHTPYWSPTFISLQSGRPALTLAIPVKGGMIVGYLDLASLNSVTDKINAVRQEQAMILDQEGTVIAHPDRRMISERQNLSYLKLESQEKQPPEGSLSYRKENREYLASLSRVPDTQWKVIVTVPADVAFETVARIRTLFGTGAAIVVFVAVMIVFLSLRKASHPLSQLVRDTRRIADGDYVIEERPSSYREIDELANHFRRMAGQLQSREGALHESEHELQERNAELTRFTYAVSHDLKSPLVTILTFLGYLENDIQNQDAGRIEQDMGYIRSAAEKMGRLLDELRELSRVGRVINPPVETSLQEIVQEALALVAGRITEKNVQIQVTEDPIILFGDRSRLVEVFQNLIDNAVKFMGEQAAPRIVIGAEKNGDEIVLFVQDNGIGIDPRYQEKIFGLFEKLDGQAEGTGMGLALVKQIVELHGGGIWVESDGLGHGACFRFTLAGTRM